MATKLEGGHTESVLCVAVNANGNIISGGESGELAIWAADGSQPQKYKIDQSAEAGDVTCIACSKRKPYELYASCGQSVFLYDMRNMNEPLYKFEFNEDEIDQIVLNEKEAFLAACDDSGHIKVINLQDRRVYKTLRKHTNICSAVCFRPKRAWDVFTAGFDCMLLQWDFSRGRTLCRINLHELSSGADTLDAYMINPPFIHSMALSPSGGLLACAADNSLVYLFNSSKRTPEYLGPLNGHSQSVSQVHFPEFKEALLVSASNDGTVGLWDLTELQGQRPGVVNGVASRNGHSSNGHAANGHAANGHVANGHMANGHAANGQGEDDDFVARAATGLESYTPTWTIDHGEKINWITSGIVSQRKTIVVADNTNTLNVYQCPE